MQNLFFELLRVALGRQDCVERAPLVEEWPELYRTAQEQELTALCYHGVERLFEYGLRGPQDLILDWMSEAETDDGETVMEYCPGRMHQPLRNWCWQRWLGQNHALADTPTMQVCALLAEAHQRLMGGRLTLQPLVDCSRLLTAIDGHFAAFADGRSFECQLRTLGLLRFSRAVMWVLQEVMWLEPRLMPCQPQEGVGRLLLLDVMGEGKGWKHFVKRLSLVGLPL